MFQRSFAARADGPGFPSFSGMNPAHLHLIVNHVPIVGSLFAVVLLAAGGLSHNPSLTKAGLLAVLAAGLLCLPAQLSGAGAAAIAQQMVSSNQALIRAHAAAAELGFWVLETAAALALFGLLLLKNASPNARLVVWLTLGVAVLSFGLLARAGNLGGQISHPEIRAGFHQVNER